jgi:hypothetical protein
MLTDREVENEEKEPVSNIDLEDIGDYPVFLESDIEKWREIPIGYLISGCSILLHDRLPVGHFVCMFFNDGNLNYFDSFGKPVPESIKQAVKGKRIRSNDVDYQDVDNATCGKHCALRLSKQDLNNEEYYDWFRELVNTLKEDPDSIVTQIYGTVENLEDSI